jgi:hypothetical protein
MSEQQPPGPERPGPQPPGPQPPSPGPSPGPPGPPTPSPEPPSPDPGPSPGPPPAPPGPGPQIAAPPAPPAYAEEAYAIKRPLGRVVGFSILSFGIYTFYWFYVTRKQLNSEMGSTEDAGLYTAGLLVPILNIIIAYWLWRDLDNLRRRVGLPEFNVVLWVVLAAFVPFASIVIYCMVVNRLNEYWDVRTQGRAAIAPVAGGEKIIVGIGIAFWALWVLIIVAIIIAAAASS